jgi:predicted ester cyclase
VSTAQNKSLIRQWVDEVVNHNNLSLARELATTEYAATHEQATNRIRSAFPDAQLTIQHMVAEANFVVVFWHAEATHLGNWRGIAPTGKRVRWSGMTAYEVIANKIDGEQTMWNRLDMYEQLVGLPDWFQN